MNPQPAGFCLNHVAGWAKKPDYSRPLYQIELPPDPEGIMLEKF